MEEMNKKFEGSLFFACLFQLPIHFIHFIDSFFAERLNVGFTQVSNECKANFDLQSNDKLEEKVAGTD